MSERGAASALGGQGGVLNWAVCLGRLRCCSYSIYFFLNILVTLVPGTPSAELDCPAKVISSYLRSWVGQWYGNGGRLSWRCIK